MGCCASKMDDSGSESGGPSIQRQRSGDNGSGCGGDGHKSINSDAASPDVREADTAVVAASIAHTLAQDTLPEGEAACPPAMHTLPNEHYFLPPTVFDPNQADAKVDASVTSKKVKKKNEKKKKSSSSSSSSSDSD